MRNRLATVFSLNKIPVYMLEGYVGELPDNDVEDYLLGQFANQIDIYFLRMILGSFLGGLENWPDANHLLACFETGGLPCGWIGPEFEKGGDPQKCMQVLHFG